MTVVDKIDNKNKISNGMQYNMDEIKNRLKKFKYMNQMISTEKKVDVRKLRREVIAREKTRLSLEKKNMKN